MTEPIGGKKPTFESGPLPTCLELASTAVDCDNVTYKMMEDVPIVEIEGGLPITDKYLTEVHKIWIGPAQKTNDGKDQVVFLEPGDVEKEPSNSPLKLLENPNSDDLLRRIEASQNNFKFLINPEEIPEVAGLKVTKPVEAEYHLGRSAKRDKTGAYNLYVYNTNKLLERECGNSDEARLKPLPNVKISPEEATLLVSVGNLSTPQYCIANDWSGKFYITDHLPTVDLLESRLLASGLFSPERAKEIANDIELAVATERRNVRNQRILIGAFLGSLIVGGLSLLLYYKMLQVVKRQTKEIDPRAFLKDITEKAKKENFTRLRGHQNELENMEVIANQQGERHIIVTGEEDMFETGDSAGTGKSELIKAYLHQKALKEKPIFELRGAALGKVAAKWVGKPEEAIDVMFEYLSKTAKDGVVWVREAHVLKGLLTSQGHPTDVVDYLLDRLEEESGYQLVFDTNKPYGKNGDGGLLDDEAFLRRVSPVLVGKTSIDEAVDIVFDNRAKYLGKDLTIEKPALKTVAILSPLTHGGNLPSRVYSLLDRTTSHLRRQKIRGEITEQMIIKTVASIAQISEEDVLSFQKFSRIAMEEYDASAGQVKNLLAQLRKAGYFLSDGKNLSVEEARALLLERAKPAVVAKTTKGPKGGDGPGESGSASGGSEPPAAAGGAEGSGEVGGEAARPAEGEPGPAKSNRTTIVLELERASRVPGILNGVKGFVGTAAPLVGLDVAEHYHVVTPTQKSVGLLGWAGAMTFVNPYTPAELVLMAPPFEAGRIATQAVLRKAGVGDQALTYRLGGTLGGLAGVAGLVRATGGPQVWHQAAVNLQNAVASGIGQAGMAIEEGVANAARSIQAGVQIYAGQAMTWARNAAAAGAGLFAAAKAGAVEAAGAAVTALDVAGTLVTPIIIVGDMSHPFSPAQQRNQEL